MGIPVAPGVDELRGVAANYTRTAILQGFQVGAGASTTSIPLVPVNPDGSTADLDATVQGAMGSCWLDITLGKVRQFRAIQGADASGTLTLSSALNEAPPAGTPVTVLTGPGFFVASGSGGNITTGNNTITNPDNVPFNLSIPGTFANNTITIVSNGTGLPVTISAQSLINSTLRVMEGDSLSLGNAASVNVNSVNLAGGLTVTSVTSSNWVSYGNSYFIPYIPPTLSYSAPGTASAVATIGSPGYAGVGSGGAPTTPFQTWIYLNAATAGTLTVSMGGFEINGTWELDGVNMGAFGTYNNVAISRGAHVILINETGWPDNGMGFNITLSNWPASSGFIVEKLGGGTLVQVGGTHSNSALTLNGDSVVVSGNLQNSVITNQSSSVTNDTLTVNGDVTNSQVSWASALNLNTGSLSDATIAVSSGSATNLNVPGGISGATVTVPANGPSLTTIAYQAITGNLTTLTNQSTYQGATWVGTGGGLTPLANSETALGANALFTSQTYLVGGLSQLVGGIYSDQSGTLQIQQSPDGSNWDVVSSVVYTGATTTGGFEVDVVEPYARFVYTNGATAQTTFRFYSWGKAA